MAWFCGYAGPYFNGAVHSFFGSHQPGYGLCFGQMDYIGPRICPDVHVAGILPRADAGGLSNRRLLYEFNHAADGLFFHDRCIC